MLTPLQHTLALLFVPALAAIAEAQCEVEALVGPGAGPDGAGRGVALSLDEAFLGALTSDIAGTGVGAVFHYDRHGLDWQLAGSLVPSAPDHVRAFGVVLDVDGDTLAVGAYQSTVGGVAAGSVLIFRRGATGWVETQELFASDAHDAQEFGFALDLDGGRLVVGAHRDHVAGPFTGAVYVFEDSGGTFVQTAKLLASDASNFASFGNAVAVQGERIVVTAHGANGLIFMDGAAYVFEHLGVGWTETAKLVPDLATIHNAFGHDVALDGHEILIGASRLSVAGIDDGAVFAFERFANGWAQTQRITAPDADDFDFFGGTLVLGDGRLFVSATGNDDVGPSSGNVYVFERTSMGWETTGDLIPTTGQPFDGFGFALATSGPLVLAGTPIGLTGNGGGVIFGAGEDCNGNGEIDVCDIQAGAATDANDNLIPDACEACLAVAYCSSALNGAGTEARIDYAGSLSVATGDFTLVTTGATALQPGLFLYGEGQTQLPFGGGFLCVDGGVPNGRVFRLDVITTDAAGIATYTVEFASPPSLAGTILGGSEWNFQFWYRDPAGPTGSSFNLSDGLAVRFCN